MKKKWTIILAIAAVFFVFPSATLAESIILSPSDFDSYLDVAAFRRSPESIYIANGSMDRVFYAPVRLPDGARITSIVVFYQDSSAAGNISVTLYKKNIYTLVSRKMAEWTSSENSTATPLIHKISPIAWGAVVNNTGYIYNVEIFFLDNTAEAGCRIFCIKIIYS